MRIRSTKPEFWKSRLITSVSWDARLVLKGLESYVDDNGVGVDDIELIVTDVFPRDMFASPRETVARVSEAITELHRAGLVWRYEGESDHLLYISFWESVQRIDKAGRGRNPRPDGTIEYRDSEIRESVASPPVTLAPGTGEQRNRGTEEQGISTPAPTVLSSAFDAAWEHWPKKVERKQAFDRFKIAVRRIDVGTLVHHITRFGDAYAATTEKQFVPALGAWINGQRWTDELPQSRGQRSTALDQNLSEYQRLYGGPNVGEGSVPALDAGVGA